MPPKKRRQQNPDKENTDDIQFKPLSIQPIINKNFEEFENDFQKEYKEYENKIQEKLNYIHQEFDKYMQTHQTQTKLARLIDQQIIRIQQINGSTITQCQELLDKTTDLMNSSADTSRTKTYLIGELQNLPLGNGNK